MDASDKKSRKGRLFIAPSTFASHFHFGCQRQLIFSSSHVDRSKWFYQAPESSEWLSYDRSSALHLEAARLSGLVEVTLHDGSVVDLNARIHHRNGLKCLVLRSNWFAELPQTSDAGIFFVKTPLSEENCTKLDAGFFMREQPIELTISGVDYVARLAEMTLTRRQVENAAPLAERPIRLTKGGNGDFERDALSVAFTSGGDSWESQILDIINQKKEKVHLGDLPAGDAEQRASDRKVELSSFIQLLSSTSTAIQTQPWPTGKREFVYQPALESPEELYKSLNLVKTQVTFSKCFPDFLQLTCVRDTSAAIPPTLVSPRADTVLPAAKYWLEITIVDAKNTDRIKLSHRIQVAIYYFIIDAILTANNLKDRVRISSTGGVWLRQQKNFNTFGLTPVLSYLRDFFKGGAWKDISETPLLQVPAQLSKKCGHCSFAEFCKSEARTYEKELSLVYGVSSYEKKYIKNFLEQEGHLSGPDGAWEDLSIENIHEHLSKHARSRIALSSSSDVQPTDFDASMAISSEEATATPSKVTKSASALGRMAPATPSTPSTPNSSQATDIYDLMSPTKTDPPQSPFFSRASSTLSTDSQDTPSLPMASAPQPFADKEQDFSASEIIEDASNTYRPLNRNLWLSLMKLRSFLKRQPVVLYQPSTLLPDTEDLAIVLNLTTDRPNGHILGWSISTRVTPGTATARQMPNLISTIGDLPLTFVTVSTSKSGDLHASSILCDTMTAVDSRVKSLVTSLIIALYSLLSFVASKMPKSSVKLYVFTPAEQDTLRECLLPLAQRAVFMPYNSSRAENEMTTLEEMALHLLTTLFQTPAAIALPHQPNIKNALPPPLMVLRPALTSLLALPVYFDADFDDFHQALCVPVDMEKYIANKTTKYSQKGMLTDWYEILKSNAPNDPTHAHIRAHFDLSYSFRASMIFDMLSSTRFIVSNIPETYPSAFKSRGGLKSTSDDSDTALICGKSKAFTWTNYVPSCHSAISKLLFANSYDMLGDSTKKMSDRLTIAFRESFQMEERVVALKLVSSYTKQRPRSVVTIYTFEYDYMSESMASALQQDISDPKTERWLLCSNTDRGISSVIAFDDYRHATPAIPGFKFSPPVELAFSTPIAFDISPSGNGKRCLSLQVKLGKKMPPLVLGHRYYLSEFMVDLTSDILKKCLSGLDLRIGFQHALAKLHPTGTAHEVHEKQAINKFLDWFVTTAETVPPKPKEKWFNVHPAELRFFDLMGGLAAFFLEPCAGSVDPEAQPAPDMGTGVQRGPEMIRVKFTPLGASMDTIGESLVWAIREFQGAMRVGTSVPLALLSENPNSWGRGIPSDFRDLDAPIARLLTLLELVTSADILTQAQNRIFHSVLKQKMTSIWGPPGTGKTYFLANMILLFLEAHREMVLKDVVITVDPPKKKSAAKRSRAKKSTSAEESDASVSNDPIHVLAHELQAGLAISPATVGSNDPVAEGAKAEPSSPAKEVPEPVTVQQLVATGAPFCVVVVAFTHRAIDNLLERFMAEDRRFRKIFGGGEISPVTLPVGRAFSDKNSSAFFNDATFSPDEIPVPLDSEADLEAFMMTNPQCVIGTTVWSLRKYARPTTEINMLVIDEASQLLLSQGLIASQWLLPSGRLVVAGDHHQLPPITNTVFPEDEDLQHASTETDPTAPKLPNATIYAKSMFEYLQERDPKKELTEMLNENWRSCATISSIPSRTIYASQDPSRTYQPANALIANQQFWLKPISDAAKKLPGDPDFFRWVKTPEKPIVPVAHPLLQLMFDSARPMGVVLLKQAAHGVALDSFPQAKLIACLTSAVRHAAQVLNPEETDASFWRSKLLVVAPHHAQRHRIRDHLLDSSPSWHVDWSPNVAHAIETVEKAQGRQFASVIVDYGIMDQYRIAKELSFLYSRNRINVAQTRAESKCLFFVSDAMLQMTPNIYNSKSIQDGFNYLQHLVNWARQQDVLLEISTDQIGAVCEALDKDPFFTHVLQETSSVRKTTTTTSTTPPLPRKKTTTIIGKAKSTMDVDITSPSSLAASSSSSFSSLPASQMLESSSNTSSIPPSLLHREASSGSTMPVGSTSPNPKVSVTIDPRSPEGPSSSQ